jgi:hypothetical protein
MASAGLGFCDSAIKPTHADLSLCFFASPLPNTG